MTAAEPFPGPQSLLDHAAFVHAVARGLLGPANADDVAQDTWLRAVRSKPSVVADLRGWLATIARNRARDVSRNEVRRGQRERAAARPEATEAVDVTYARLDAQRDVVAKILALDEPYKSVVILRYYHELSHDEIAARLGSKPATVRTQLVRAHEQLRTKLDREYGDRKAWAGLLTPSLSDTTRAASLVPAVVAAAVVAGVGAFLFLRSEPMADPIVAAQLASPSNSAPELQTSDAPVMTVAGEQGRTEVATSRDVEPADETLCEPAELFDRSHFNDYEKATFSFEHGLRDDPLGEVRNDWDLLFSWPKFVVHTVVDDTSLIVDLGEVPLDGLAVADLQALTQRVAVAASENAADPEGRAGTSAPVLAGHAYFVWTKDRESNLVSAFEVVDLVEGSHCMLDWYSTADGRTAKGSIRDASRGRSLMATLIGLRDAVRSSRELREPRVVIQVRSGAVGGNQVKVCMTGEAERIRQMQAQPLSLATQIDSRESQSAFVSGGFVPHDAVFVVTQASYRGRASGDSNGPGELRVELAGQTLFETAFTEEWIRREWTGRVEIRPGDEARTFLQVRNSSVGEFVLEGEFVRAAAAPAEPRPIVAAAATRALRRSAGPRRIESAAPRIALGPSNTAVSLDGRQRLEWREGRVRIRSDQQAPIALIDLGESKLEELAAPAADSERARELRAQAVRQLTWPTGDRNSRWPDAPAASGHVYLLLIDPFDDEPHSALLRCVEATADGKFVFDSYVVKSEIGAVGSLARSSHPRGLDQVLEELVDVALADFTLAEPRFEIQIRPERDSSISVGMNSRTDPRSRCAFAELPLDLEAPEARQQNCVAFVSGGRIPRDQQLVITRVEYGALPREDASFPGDVLISRTRSQIARFALDREPVDGVWTGALIVRPGEEESVLLDVSYARSAWARFEGHFEPLREH